MLDWLKNVLGDAFHEVIQRGWFGRNDRVPDHAGPGSDMAPDAGRGVLDLLFASNPEHVSGTETHDHEAVRGLDLDR